MSGALGDRWLGESSNRFSSGVVVAFSLDWWGNNDRVPEAVVALAGGLGASGLLPEEELGLREIIRSDIAAGLLQGACQQRMICHVTASVVSFSCRHGLFLLLETYSHIAIANL